MPIRAALPLILVMATGAALPARAQDPLSAIDWLSSSVATPAGAAVGAPALPAEAPVTSGGALPQDVAVSVLDAPSPDAIGLLSPATSGLPRDLWGMGLEEEVRSAIASERNDLLPALQSLTITLMLAEAAPPPDSSGKGALLLARIDRLLSMGALDQAAELLEAAPAGDPELFRRAFDVALLTGNEERGCEMMRATPNLAPTFPARIFCVARSGDWNAAALTLRTAQALGYVTEEEDSLLSRFLDPDLYEGDALPPIPARMTPLAWRMFEAIGEPQSTMTLPLAFAHAELRDTAGWKSQIESAERLARAGVIAPNVLLGLYTERLPAASGGVWDRVDAFQRFETALRAGDPGAVAQSLPAAWARMTEAELEVPFATLFAEDLSRLPLTGQAGKIAFELGLLSPRYEAIAKARKAESTREAFLIGLATGSLSGAIPPDTLGRAIAPAFLRSEPTAEFAALIEQRRIGEGILLAIEKIGRGVQGDLSGVTEGLAFLRHIGLEDTARQTALELMLLERRG
ncbi:hypothetical protein [Pseudotabrizicola algicola]|uniref:Antifreeze protein n=1 Tax=Pseudotabrizicola algicola TaxID=2709381 RepID=A0A6B3RG30_9RHOB|nr:hypothetical protein [Pseudotabrizicola algicola]NEX44927.1 hypothetical protein [Pseudotabrizicola algicola]